MLKSKYFILIKKIKYLLNEIDNSAWKTQVTVIRIDKSKLKHKYC